MLQRLLSACHEMEVQITTKWRLWARGIPQIEAKIRMNLTQKWFGRRKQISEAGTELCLDMNSQDWDVPVNCRKSSERANAGLY